MTAPKAKHRVPDVIRLVHQYYLKPGNGAGGNLHIVLDDFNIDDASVLHCLEWAEKCDDADGAALARILLECSKSQRRRIVKAAYP